MDYFPFTLKGPEFLGFFLVFSLACFGIAFALRAGFRWMEAEPMESPSSIGARLDAYEVAYLAGGSDAALDAAVTKLVAEGLVRPPRAGYFRAADVKAPAGLHPFERAVLRLIRGGARGHLGLKTMRRQARGATRMLHADLTRETLVPGGLQLIFGLGLGTLIAAAPVLLAIVRMVQAAGRKKPVGFLGGLTFLVVIGIIALVVSRPRRTRAGDEVLKDLVRAGLQAITISLDSLAGEEPGAFYKEAYSAALALLNAIEKAGSTKYEDVEKALREDWVETPVGKISFDGRGDAKGVGFSMYQVQNGVYVEMK